MLDNLKTQKLQIALEKIPKRTLKDAAGRILESNNRLKAALRRLFIQLQKKPKEAVDTWKDYIDSCKKNALLDALKAKKLQECLNKIPQRTLRDANNRILGQGDKVAGALRRLEITIKKSARGAFNKWANFCKDCKDKKMLDNLRTQQLKNTLRNLPKRTLKDAADRVKGQGDKVKGALRGAVVALKKVPRDALQKWKDFVDDCKKKKATDALTAKKLQTALEKVPIRTLRDAHNRLIGEGDKIAGAIRRLDINLKKKPKQAFDKWKNYLKAVNDKKVTDNLKTQQLKDALKNIPKRTIRDAVQRIKGDGDKVKGALRAALLILKKAPKQAFDKWKDFCNGTKQKDSLDTLKAEKLKNGLRKIPARTLRDALNRMVPDAKNDLHAEKLRKALDKIPLRTLRSAFNPIILDNSDKIKSALRNLAILYYQRPRDCLNKWKLGCEKKKTADSNKKLKGAMLKNALEKPVRKQVRSGRDRCQPSDKVKKTLQIFALRAEKMPKDAINKWKAFLNIVKNDNLSDAVRAQKLRYALERIPIRTLKNNYDYILQRHGTRALGILRLLFKHYQEMPSEAMKKWKDFVNSCKQGDLLNAVNAQKLKIALERIPIRTTRDAYQRVLGDGDKLAGNIRRILIQLQKKPRVAFNIWKQYIQDCKARNLFDNVRSQKLKNALERIPKRTLKDVTQRIIGGGDKVKGAIKNVMNAMIRKPRDALQKWKDYIKDCQTKKAVNALKANKLKTSLEKVLPRTLRDAHNRIIGQGSKILGALRRMEIQLKNKPRNAFNKWKLYLQACKEKGLLDNVRTQKLANIALAIPRRTLREAYQRVVGEGDKVLGALRRLEITLKRSPKQAFDKWAKFAKDCNSKNMLDNLRTQKLKSALEKIPTRTMKDAADKILGNGNRLKGALRRLWIQLQRKPKDAFEKWKDFVHDSKKNNLLDALKAKQLQDSLLKIPQRTIRDAYNRITGQGNQVAGALRRLEITLKKKEGAAFNKWINFCKDIDKKKMIDNLRTQQLKNALRNIPKRTMKDATDRIKGEGDKVKGAIRTAILALKRKPRDALQKWKDFVEDCKKKKTLDALNAKKLQTALEKLPQRTLRDAHNRIVGEGNKVAGALRRLEINLKKKPKQAFDKWKDYLRAVKEKKLMDNVRVQQLRAAMKNIPRRTLKDAAERVKGEGDKVKGVLRAALSAIKKAPKQAFDKWKDCIRGTKDKETLVALNAKKLHTALEKIPQRTMRDAYNRITSDSNIVKSAIRGIVIALNKKSREAFDIWNKFNKDCNKKNVMDQLKTEKLRNALANIPRRILKDAHNRIIGQGKVVAGALRRLQIAINKKPKQAFDKWKDFVNDTKTKKVLDNLRSEKLRNTLAKIPLRTTRDAFERVIGGGDKVKGALRRLMLTLQKKTKAAFDKWNKFNRDCTDKKLTDNTRTEKLRNALARIPIRTVKDAADRILGGNNKVAGALRRLEISITKKPKQAFNKWKDFIQDVKEQKLVDNVRAKNLNDVLRRIPLRTSKDAFNRIIGQGNNVAGALRRFEISLQKKPKQAFDLWKDYVKATKDKKILDALNARKLNDALAKIPVRTLRNSFNSIVATKDRLIGALKALARRAERMPKVAFDKLAKNANKAKADNLKEELKGQQLKNVLRKIPARTLRDAYGNIVPDTKNDKLQGEKLRKALDKIPLRTLRSAFNPIILVNADKIKSALRNLAVLYYQRPRDCLNKWKLGCEKKKTADSNKKLKGAMLKNALEKPVRKQVRSGRDRCQPSDKVKKTLQVFALRVEKMPRDAISKWKAFLNLEKNDNLSDAIRAEKLRYALGRIPIRTLKNNYDYILQRHGTRALGILRLLFKHYQEMPSEAMKKWKDFVNSCKQGDLLNAVNAQKLKIALERIPTRTTRDAYQRILGDGDKLAGNVRRILIQLQKKPRVAFNIWKQYIQDCKARNLFDNVRSQKLKNALERIPKRTLKDATQRIIGGGDKVKGAIKNVMNAMIRKPRDALQKWKDYIKDCQTKKAVNALKANKLKNCLEKVLPRTLRDAHNRIIGQGSKILGALRRMEIQLKNKPRNAFNKWKLYLQACKEKGLLDNVRTQKLANIALAIPRRTLREAYQRVVGEGDKVLGALRRLEITLKRSPKQAFDKWAKFAKDCNSKNMLDNLRTQKLKSALEKIPTRTMKDAADKILGNGNRLKGALRRLWIQLQRKPKDAFEKWKDFVYDSKKNGLLDALKAKQLQDSLLKIPQRTLRDSYNRINGEGNKLAGVFRRLEITLKKSPKAAFDKWADFCKDCEKKKMIDNLRTQQLKNALRNIPKRTMKDAADRVKGEGDKVKGAIRGAIMALKKKPRDAMQKWKDFVEDCKKRKTLDALNAKKLQTALEKLPQRTLRDAHNRIVGEGNKVAGALRRLEINLKKKPKQAFDKWKDYLRAVKEKKLMDNVRVQQLRAAMKNIPRRTLKDAAERVKGEGDKVKGVLRAALSAIKKAPKQAFDKWKDYIRGTKDKETLVSLNAKKLHTALEKIPQRTMRDAYNRITNDSNIVKSAIRGIVIALNKKSREAFDIWNKFNKDCNKKNVMDQLKTEKLRNALANIPRRILKDAHNRIIGQGKVVAGALRRLQIAINKKPKQAFDKWKDFVNDTKTKKVLDNLRSEKLRNTLAKIPLRTTRDAFERVIGGGDKVKGALRRLMLTLQKKTKAAFDKWNKFNRDCTDKKLTDNTRTEKLRNALVRIPIRTVKDAADRILGGDNKIAGALRRLEISITKKPKQAFNKWKDFVQDVKEQKLVDNVRAKSLNDVLRKIPLRTSKDAFNRIIGQGNNVAGALRRLEISLQKKPKQAFDLWKDYVKATKDKKVLDALNARKLNDALAKIPARTLRNSFNSIVATKDRVIGALKALARRAERMPKVAFDKLAKNANKAKTDTLKEQADNLKEELKGQQLKNVLRKIPARTLREAYAKIVPDTKNDKLQGEKLRKALDKIPIRTLRSAFNPIILVNADKIKSALRNLAVLYYQRPRDCLNKWKLGCEKKKTADSNKKLKGAMLKNALEKPVRKQVRSGRDRCQPSDKVKKTLQVFALRVEKMPRDAISKWKAFLNLEKNDNLSDAVRAQKLRYALDRIPIRTLKNNYDFILQRHGTRALGILRLLFKHYQEMPSEAMKKWKDFVNNCKQGDLLNAVNAQKLKIALERIPARTIKDAHQRILGDGDKFAGNVRRILIQLQKKPRIAFNIWKQYIQDCKTRNLFDNVRSQKLKNALGRIPKRTIKDATQRIIGGGDKVKGAIKNVMNAMIRKPRDALQKWKDYIKDCQTKKAVNALKANKLKTSLEKVIPRTLRDAHNRIVGQGSKILGALRRMEIQLKNKPRNAFNKWKLYLQACKEKGLLDNVRSQKLANIALAIPRRTLRDTYQRIVGEGDKVLGALKKLEVALKRSPKQAFDKWAKFAKDCGTKNMLDNLRTQKLQNALEKIPKRTIKDAADRILGAGNKVRGALRRLFIQLQKKPKDAFEKWKDFVNDCKKNGLLDALKAKKLQDLVLKIPQRTIRDAYTRVVGQGNQIAGIFRRLEITLKKSAKGAFSKWANFCKDCNTKKMLDNVRTQQLKNLLQSIPRRTLKDATDRIKGEGDKVKGAMRSIINSLKRKPKDAFEKWKAYLSDIKTKNVLDALNAKKLQAALGKVPQRTLRDSLSRLIGEGSKLAGAIRRLDINLKKKPKEAFEKWKKYVRDCNEKKIMDNLKTEKLKHAVERIPRRTLKDAIGRVIGESDKLKGALRTILSALKRSPKQAYDKWKDFVNDCKNKNSLDALNAKKLQTTLEKLPQRTMRDAYSRILGDNNIVKGAIRRIMISLNKKTKEAFDLWEQFNKQAKKKTILDQLRTEKLRNALSNIPRRVIKDAHNRIIGQGKAVAGALRRLQIAINKKPKQAFDKWKDFIHDIETKKVLDNLRSEKLRSTLAKLPLRTVKDTVERIIGGGDKVKGALRRIMLALQKKTKTAFDKWRIFTKDCNEKKWTDNARTEKLRNALAKIPARIVKDAADRIIGGNNKVAGALRRLEIAITKKPKAAFDKWKNYLQACREKKLMDNVKATSLENTLKKIPLRTAKDALNRVLGQGNTVAGALRRLEISLQKKPKHAFDLWKNFNQAVKDKKVLDSLNATKLKDCLSKIPVRTLRNSFNSIATTKDRLISALKALARRADRMPKLAFDKLAKNAHQGKADDLKGELKGQQLKNVLRKIPARTLRNAYQNLCPGLSAELRGEKLRAALNKIPARTLRSAFNPIVLDNSEKVKSVFRNLAIMYDQKPRDALNRWKLACQKKKVADSDKKLKGVMLKSALDKPVRKAVRSGRDKCQISEKTKAALKALSYRCEKLPQDSIRKWAENVLGKKAAAIQERMRSEKLRSALFRISQRVLKESESRIVAKTSRVKFILVSLALRAQRRSREAFDKLRSNVHNSIKNQIATKLDGEKLRQTLDAIPRRILKNCLLRIVGGGSLVAGALARFNEHLNKIKRFAVFKWRVVNDAEKHVNRYRLVASLFAKLQQGSRFNLRMAFKMWTNDKMQRIIQSLRKINLIAEDGARRAIGHWFAQSMKIKGALLAKYAPALQNLFKLREKCLSRNINNGFRTWLNAIDRNKIKRRTISKVMRNLVGLQKGGIETLRERVLKLKMIKKVNGAYLISRIMEAKAKIMMRGRLSIWSQDEKMRILRLKKKYLLSMINLSSISYQTSVWRWKYVITRHGVELHPKQTLMWERIIRVGNQYQRRLKQFAMFKLILTYRTALPIHNRQSVQLAVSSLLRASNMSRDGRMSAAMPNLREGINFRTPSPERPTTAMDTSISIPITTTASQGRSSMEEPMSGKMSKEEIAELSKNGATEVICLQLREVRVRQLAIGFSSIASYSRQVGLFEDERTRLIESINELRYDKHSLLEDNTALRHHNEALIESLEATNMNFHALTLQLDQMRLGRMVRVISKMIEIPVLEALIVLRHNAGILSP
ncbi:unnamed protein product [Blepharisma stoltei]|uniref:Uncharacterized protein n=1 Tax=Blepharisma stoltei TaxID=1481888 RepID=A0AAU9I9Y7_9CILI|nr:unnamed protein product [Blepharisma stoltei]